MIRVFTVAIESDKAGWHATIADELGRTVKEHIQGKPGLYEVTQAVGVVLCNVIAVDILKKETKC